jgi:hypothetical protein
MASSAVLAANQLLLGGGAGASPATLGSLGSTTTVLHGNAAGAPTFGAVSLTADVTGTLPVGNGGTGVTSSTGSGSVVLSASPTLTGTVTAATIAATTVTVGGNNVCQSTGTNCPTKAAYGFINDLGGSCSLAAGSSGASACTKNGTGDYTVTLTAFGTFAACTATAANAPTYTNISTISSGSVRILVFNNTPAASNSNVNFVCSGQ